MEIYLMQHGQAFSEEADPERSLTPEGEDQILTSARALVKMGILFDLVVSSPKKRALQTARLTAGTLNYPLDGIKVTETLNPTALPVEAIGFLKAYEDKTRVLLAGHLPSLGEIASELLTEGPRVFIHFEMGGLCRIDVDFPRGEPGELKWSLLPEHLRLIAG
ncbi:MAG: phosphohistidine phosphatase SixA [Deltaproteobacteria bacterium]|nr:phosphohistidine phosphatase SixA [Deltaproteobacteria bacterium]MBW2123296.1 phosphohistidine phosphatase SixA [Deltaproteobacteria bacterium]